MDSTIVFEDIYNRHYIIIDDRSRITDRWSDGPHPDRDTFNAICINEQGGYQFRLIHGGEENPPLYTMDGIPLYKYVNGEVLPRAEEEIAADLAAIPLLPPTAQEETDVALLDLDYRITLKENEIKESDLA